MDASKAIAAMATNAGDVWEYISGGTGQGKTLEKDPLPLIAVTTTAGTGSEVDAWGVISNPETNEKIGFGGDDRLFPVLAVVDPQLMLTVPRNTRLIRVSTRCSIPRKCISENSRTASAICSPRRR